MTTALARPLRVLQVSHGWEARGGGGAERSAAALTSTLGRRPDVDATMIACVSPAQLDARGPLAMDDATGTRLIVSQTDWIFFSWLDPQVSAIWRDVLHEFRPDIVHMHHYAHAGIELPLVVKQELPAARVVLTLHEFLALCPRSGQMVQRGGQLCNGPGIRKCADCMEWDVSFTAARDHYVRAGLSHVDAFTSPSRFLADRYVTWGLPRNALHVIPNVLEGAGRPLATRNGTDPFLRIGYLGQHTPMKGLSVLLDAIDLLPKAVRQACAFEIYGSGADRFGEDFLAELATHRSLRHREVSLEGPYSNERVSDILDHLDLIVVPSTWWENSPVVIEEALSRGVPVLCSDIGGMAEKVRPGIDGWHFRVGDSRSLAGRLADLVASRPWSVVSSMRLPPPSETTAESYVRLYRRLHPMTEETR